MTAGGPTKDAPCYLATCYELSGNDALAVTYLEQYILESGADPRACMQLGTIFNRQGNFSKAVQYFQHIQGGDRGQVQLAVSKGNAQMDHFFKMIVQNDVKGLVQWKNSLSLQSK